jgi:peptidylprolyl isomerase
LVTSSLLHAQTPAAPQPKTATAKAGTAAKPATTAKAGTAAKTGTTAHTAAAAGSAAIKLPKGVPPATGALKTGFALRYQDTKLGTGADAEPNKVYEVRYTGWLAADGTKFDSSEDHPDKAPIKFLQGRRGVIPGWDQGFDGMKVGGKRRLFIPYQLAYGATGRPPVIPAKADLIFDIELVSVQDLPAAPPRPTPPAPGTAPGSGSGAAPSSTTPPPASGKPADPTAPTTAPNSAPAPPPTATTPPPAPPTGAPDKPANPEQPHN